MHFSCLHWLKHNILNTEKNGCLSEKNIRWFPVSVVLIFWYKQLSAFSLSRCYSILFDNCLPDIVGKDLYDNYHYIQDDVINQKLS